MFVLFLFLCVVFADCYVSFLEEKRIIFTKLTNNHSFHVKWVKCSKDFRKIEGQQIRQVVSLTERCIIEG